MTANYFETASIDETVMRKQAITKRLLEVLEANKKGIEEEKKLKKQIAELMQPDETVNGVTRKVIKKFKPSEDLEDYLKEAGLWKAVTIREPKILKAKVAAQAESDEELQDLFDSCLVDQNRIELKREK